MIKQTFASGIGTGLIVGLLVTLIQHFTTVPLILHAEKYENAEVSSKVLAQTSASAPARASAKTQLPYRLAHAGNYHDNFRLAHNGHHREDFKFTHSDEHPESGAWSPADGWQRTLASGVSTIIICIAFAMLLAACYAFSGHGVDGRSGILWGLGGFAAFVLAPSLGLPAELPGTLAADISDRQFWWVLAAVCTAAGIAIMVFVQPVWLKLAGLVLILFPHAWGAPHPDKIGGAVPPELAAHFAATSIVIGAVTWVLLGWVSGSLFKKLENF